jgi:hypothetical protein
MPPRQNLLTDHRHTSLHFPFVAGHLHLGWVGHESIVSLQFGVGWVERRIVQIGLQHTVFQIVQHDEPGAALKKREGADVAIQPGGAVLAKNEAHEAVAAVT